MNFNLERLAKDLSDTVEEQLIKMGVLYRLFNRAKSFESIQLKQAIKKYSGDLGAKKMQDIIGLRITLYFADDIEIVKETLKNKFEFIDETIDKSELTQFKPTRINLIFRCNDVQSRELNDTIINNNSYIDDTYEIQIRTVLSEGWHEVDHDLRYKCQGDWENDQDLGRAFNGVFAGLETSDWSTLMIFEKLAHRHYKNSKWQAMLRTKFRLRLLNGNLDQALIDIINKDQELAKRIYRLDRHSFLKEIIIRDINIPFTLSNILYLSNCMFLGDNKIYALTPKLFLDDKRLNRIVDEE